MRQLKHAIVRLVRTRPVNSLVRRLFLSLPWAQNLMRTLYFILISQPNAGVLRLEPARPSHIQTLYADISNLVREDLKTGVQRVTRNLLKALQAQAHSNFRVVPFYHDGRHLRCYKTHPDDPGIAPQQGDVVLGLDLCPHDICLRTKQLESYREQGTKMAFVVHDLLPITHPQHFPDNSTYLQWLQTITHLADDLFFNSHHSLSQYHNWRVAHNTLGNNHPQLHTFRVGSGEYGKQRRSNTFIKNNTNQLQFLTVGTLEPRKGYALALDAFEHLWSEGFKGQWVIVGKHAWMSDELVERIQAHPELNRKLIWTQQLSDDKLDHLYQTSTALVAPSEAEGFGLPLIEAAQHGLPIIARDIDVFREVCGEHAHYFHGDQAQTLSNAINNWIRLNQTNSVPQSGHIQSYTWDDGAMDILRIFAAHQSSR